MSYEKNGRNFVKTWVPAQVLSKKLRLLVAQEKNLVTRGYRVLLWQEHSLKIYI